jgi:hypothetical protein
MSQYLSNRPKPLSQAEVREYLVDTQSELVARRDEILAGAKRFDTAYPDGIPDETVQGRCADFAGSKGIMGVFLREVETNRTTEKLPFRLGGEAVDGFFETLSEPVEKVQAHMRSKMNTFAAKLEAERIEAARLEAERLAAAAAEAEEALIDAAGTEQAEELAIDVVDLQRAADAAATLAAGKSPELSRTRGDMGTVVSLRSRYVADYDASNLMELVKAVAAGKAPLTYLAFNTTRINYAIRSEKVREIPGVVIKQERGVV